MNLTMKLAAACLLSAASGAIAAPDAATPCTNDPKAIGLPQRMELMREQMQRIEYATDAEDRRRLMDLHMKTMHEGVREMHRRGPSVECRMDLMQGMMEQMMRHELAGQADEDR